jgi:hypothetical protein
VDSYGEGGSEVVEFLEFAEIMQGPVSVWTLVTLIVLAIIVWLVLVKAGKV